MNAPSKIPEYKMVPSESTGCDGCAFRYMREVRCSLIDCRPRNGYSVKAVLIKEVK